MTAMIPTHHSYWDTFECARRYQLIYHLWLGFERLTFFEHIIFTIWHVCWNHCYLKNHQKYHFNIHNSNIYLFQYFCVFVVNDVLDYFRFIYHLRSELILNWSALVWCWHKLWSTLKANNCFWGWCFSWTDGKSGFIVLQNFPI